MRLVVDIDTRGRRTSHTRLWFAESIVCSPHFSASSDREGAQLEAAPSSLQNPAPPRARIEPAVTDSKRRGHFAAVYHRVATTTREAFATRLVSL